MLEICGLSKFFGDTLALDGINLQARQGETVVIMGPSGCGKSTTIRAVNRLIEPDAGHIYFDGLDITALPAAELSAVRKRIGYVFQHFNLIARLTVEENVMLGLIMGRMPRELARQKAQDALRRVGLEKHCAKRPGQLSGGQQQRVSIARALAFEPELMLWDEPTASLDPILVREVLVIMEEVAREHLATMLVVTHELSFALKVADRIVLMDRGRIVEEGSSEQIFFAPQSHVGRTYRELLEYQYDVNKQNLS